MAAPAILETALTRFPLPIPIPRMSADAGECTKSTERLKDVSHLNAYRGSETTLEVGPSKKRPRLEDEEGDSEEEFNMAFEEIGRDIVVTRHPKYYMPDGDCIIRVEDTLFRVRHGSLCKCNHLLK